VLSIKYILFLTITFFLSYPLLGNYFMCYAQDVCWNAWRSSISVYYCSLILTKTGNVEQILVKLPIKCHENPLGCFHIVSFAWTDGWSDCNGYFTDPN